MGHIVNTSSINGFWASVGPRIPHTSYSAAKFAVKGFTEALITDLRINAPHIKCSVVMPGQIGTWLPYRELDNTLGLTDTGGDMFADARTGRNGRHRLVGFLRQSVFGRLAGYEDVNDAPPWALLAGGHVRSLLEDWPPSLWPNHRPAGMGTVAAFSFQSF